MTPPRNAVQRRGGGRFYPYPLHAPESEQKHYPSSTSATGMWPKPWAMPWASKMAAERAVELHRSGGLDALLQQGDKVALDAIKGAFRHARDDAAVQGSKVHEAWEEYLKDRNRLDEIRGGLPELALAMFDGLMELTLKYNVEWERSEQTAYNHEHEYAGTFDGIVVMDTPSGRRRLLVDIKTSKGATRDEYAAQLASYRFATNIVHDDGTEEAMPSVEGCVIFHVRPDEAHVIPVNTDEEVFASFLTCLSLLRHTKSDRQLFWPPLPEPEADKEKQ